MVAEPDGRKELYDSLHRRLDTVIHRAASLTRPLRNSESVQPSTASIPPQNPQSREAESSTGPAEVPVCELEISALQKRIAELQDHRRHRTDFQRWKPGIFYYLFVPVLSTFVSWLSGPFQFSLQGLWAGVLCCGALCYGPTAANLLRYWRFRRPNRQLEKQSAFLQSEIQRRKAERQFSYRPGSA